MPRPEVEGVGPFDVEGRKRLVLTIEEKASVDIMHGRAGDDVGMEPAI